MSGNKKSDAEGIAARIIEELKNGTAPWIRPWEAGEMPAPPVNALTGRPYRGINQLWLSVVQPESDDPRWCTYRQAERLGAQVRGGSRGTLIHYWKQEERKLVRDEDGLPLLDENGEKCYQTIGLGQPRPYSAVVFHASQIDGLPPLPEREGSSAPERHDQAERVIRGTGAAIFHDQANRAFYRPLADAIHLPKREQFKSPDACYATTLHELGHWTGHESRLNRDTLGHPFGSAAYAREELRAEIASYMLGMELNIGHDPGRHHTYMASWIEALEKDPNEIMRAARDADLIKEYVMGRDRDIVQMMSVPDPQGVSWEPAYPSAPAPAGPALAPEIATEKTWLNVPYKEKDAARAAGQNGIGRRSAGMRRKGPT